MKGKGIQAELSATLLHCLLQKGALVNKSQRGVILAKKKAPDGAPKVACIEIQELRHNA